VFGVPDALIGGAVHAFSGLTHEHGRFSRAGEADRSMMVRMSGALDVVSRDRPFDDFATLLGEREARYVARWQESPLATVEADTEFDPVDSGDYLRDQRKILVHALGRSYLGRYGESIDDGLRREAFDFSRWGAVDCVVGPALVGGYLFWRGWDGRMLVGDFDCRLNLLPLQRIESHLRKTDDLLLTAASLEIGVQGLPVRFILSGGLNDGHPEFDFIGIGTSLAVARKSLKLASDSQDPER
jgi:hypothetical protein